MSGGSMNYLYSQLEDASFELNTPERIAFQAHLQKVAKALHDIEWVDSGDFGLGGENKAIRDCLSSAEREACASYLKEGETPLERIERAHHENLSLMTLLAKEKTKNETLDAECNDLARQLNESNERNGRLIAQRNELLEALKQIEPILARMYGSQVVPPMQIVCAAIANATGGAA